MQNKSALLAFLPIVTACSDINDPVVSRGYDALYGMYAVHVKPENASFTSCKYALIQERNIVRCGTSYGSTELADKGYWEVVVEDGSPVMYAMNGEAVRALNLIPDKQAFKSGAGQRKPIDVVAAETAMN